MQITRISAWLLLAGTLVTPVNVVQARIKLITLPIRERVEIQLDHAGATLVEEERLVPLTEGVNKVDFSWANTSIDPDTILFRVVGSAYRINVLSVSYPPGENALVWRLSSPKAGSARIRISYLLGNLTKSFNYRAIASSDERFLDLAQFLRLRNLTNESFDRSGLWVGYGDHFIKPIGLDETREILVHRYQRIPINKRYVVNPSRVGYLDRAQAKLRVAMHYVIKNQAAPGALAGSLGRIPLPQGKVRIFQRDGHGGSVFLGEDWGKFTAPDDEMTLYLGTAEDIVVKRIIEKRKRRRVAGNVFQHDIVIRYEVQNFKSDSVSVSIEENIRELRAELGFGTARDAEWSLGEQTRLRGELDMTRTNSQSLTFDTRLDPASVDATDDKHVVKVHLVMKNEW